MDAECSEDFFLHSSAFVKANHCDSGNLNVMSTWNDYLLPSLVINKEGIQTLPLKTFLFLDNSQKEMGFSYGRISYVYDTNYYFYLCCQKYIVKGVTEGAVKG